MYIYDTVKLYMCANCILYNLHVHTYVHVYTCIVHVIHVCKCDFKFTVEYINVIEVYMYVQCVYLVPWEVCWFRNGTLNALTTRTTIFASETCWFCRGVYM